MQPFLSIVCTTFLLHARPFVARTLQVLKRNGRNLKLMLRCLEGLAECAAGLGNFKEAIDLERRRFELSR
jgi:hypothetical protein